MRTPLRRAVFSAIAGVVLVGTLGLTSCADPDRDGAVDAGSAPADTSVIDAPGPADSASPSASTSASRSPSPSVSLSFPPPASRSTKPSLSRSPSRVPTSEAATPAASSNIASRLHTIPAGTRQLIVVHTNGYGTSVASLETFEKVNGVWRPKFGVMSARIGAKGFSDSHQEGISTTPTGVYGIGSTMYGVLGNPGVKYSYHHLVANDYWDENPSSPTYNSFVHGTNPGGYSEALWQTVPQYNYFAVINYNIPVRSATPARGSGIFLHVSGSGATAGCVSLAQSNLLRVLEWLDPAASPRIVMAPSQNLGRY
ncbi:L,D-transpeptidase family protein [Micromonospora musae]|uniref:L,D-transpeptidase family protein n=1 Tax=Micromonospora musae TaxID=1894970 RepID=UPI0011C3A605|nr:L,D-transpeptidase family protein [Micromonospora musae]